MSKTVDGRTAYLDLFRVLALVSAIMLHVALWYRSAAHTQAAGGAELYICLTCWCVGGFAMLSGATLLDAKKSASPGSLALRILRVAVCLAVWTSLYLLEEQLLEGGRVTLSGFLSGLEAPFSGTVPSTLWFLWIILGFYLLLPLLRAFVRGASQATLRYALALSFVTVFLLPAVLAFFPNRVVSFLLQELWLAPVAGCFFYFLAGHYLRCYLIGRLPEVISYVLGAAGALALVWASASLSGSAREVMTGYLSPAAALFTVAVFILFRYVLGVSDERGRSRGVTAAAKCSFGIFLFHHVFYLLFRHLGLFALPIPTVLAIPLWAAALFLPSFLLAWLVNSIPVVGRYLT